MKKKISKLIICISCILLLLMFMNNILIVCDTHIFECNHDECARCLFIHNTQEMLKNIFIIICIGVLFLNIRLIDKVILFFKNIVYTNLVSMKVILNE